MRGQVRVKASGWVVGVMVMASREHATDALFYTAGVSSQRCRQGRTSRHYCGYVIVIDFLGHDASPVLIEHLLRLRTMAYALRPHFRFQTLLIATSWRGTISVPRHFYEGSGGLQYPRRPQADSYATK